MPTPAPARRELVLLTVVSAAYILLAGSYCAVTPYSPVRGYARLDRGQANPDEHAHVEYVQTIAAGHLPVLHGSYAESHQPPLYYAVGALAYTAARAAPGKHTVTALRWLSIVIGLALIWATYFCVRQIEFTGADLALFCAAFVAFLPTQTATCASVSNDSLSFAAAAFAVGCLVRVARAGASATWREKAMLGVALGLGLWSKSLTLPLIPAVAAVYAALAIKKILTPRAAIRDCGITIGCGLLIALPWLVRNIVVYGDPFAARAIVSGMRGLGHVGSAPQLAPMLYWQKVVRVAFQSYWATFDSMFLTLAGPIYGVLGLAVIASLLGLRRWVTTEKPSQADMSAVTALAFVMLFVILAFVKSNTISFQAQGRYLYTALVPFTLFFALGLRSLAPPRWQSHVQAAAALGMVAFDAACGVVVARWFG